MKKIQVAALIAASLMAIGIFAGCSSNKSATSETKKVVELKVPSYKMGGNVGAKVFVPQVERFNQMYKGKYKITLEQTPQDGYSAKIQQLAQQNKLPAIVDAGACDQDWFKKAIVEPKKYYDLSKWLDANQDIKGEMIPESIKYVTAADGSVVSTPVAIVSPIGIFYNSDLYKPSKRIGEMSLDEFEASLGSNKISLMTGENAWTTALLFTDFVASEPGGVDMLKKGVIDKVYDYKNDIWVNAATRLQKYLQKYASSNTIGAAYADAANNFMSKSSALIPNGPWMVGDFAAESKDKWSNGFDGTKQVKGDIYPGNIAIANVFGYQYFIPKGLPQEETDAALAFLKFINSPEELQTAMLEVGGSAPMLKVSDDFLSKQKEKPILNDLATAVTSKTILVPGVLDVMPSSVANVEFSKLLPKLKDGSLTPKDFCKTLTQLAADAKAK
jgi:raffinose/stachyose/melibiose transport system substrate-binding protein